MDTPTYHLTMVNMLRAVYWYDEALQSQLLKDGWTPITRTQSLLLANIGMGETRPARLARNMGMTRQSMSDLINGLVKRGLLMTMPDPNDGRAQIIGFHPDGQAMVLAVRDAFKRIAQTLEDRIGKDRLAALNDALEQDWGAPPFEEEDQGIQE